MYKIDKMTNNFHSFTDDATITFGVDSLQKLLIGLFNNIIDLEPE